MKISYLSSVRIPSEKASGLAIARQCEAFADIGHEVELFIPNRAGSVTKTLESEYAIKPKFKLTYFKSKAIYNFRRMGFFAMLIRDSYILLRVYYRTEVKPDIIYSRDHRLLFVFVLFGLKEKCFIEMHTKHDDFITKYVLRRVKKVIVISDGLADFYSQLTGRNDIQVEPSGVYLEQFENLPETTVSRENLALPKDKKIFAYIGKYKTMGETKGVDEIIEAFAAVIKKHPAIFLYLVGIEEEEKYEVTKLIEETGLKLETDVRLETLDQARFAEYLNASDILLMNYPNTEHYAKYMSPTKLFAYMAAGKPFITTRLESIEDFTDFGVVYVDPDIGYADSLELSLKEYGNLIKSAQNNVSLVEQYSWLNRAGRILRT